MEENRETKIRNIEETQALEEKTIADDPTEAFDVPEDEATVADLPEEVANDEATVADPPEEVTEDESTVAETASSDDAAVSLEDLEKATPAADEKAESAEESKGEDSKQYGLPADHPEMGELRDRIEKRKKEKKKKQRHFRTWVYVTAFILMAVIFGFFFSISGFFTVDSIEVQGNEHYTSEEIINIAHAVPGRNLLYNTNKLEIVSYLEQNPYIKTAEVRRKLPSTLLIVVTERSEKMAFKYDNDYLVMDGEGILLRKTRTAPQTTLIEGLIVNKIKLGEKIGTEDRDKTNKAIDLISAMTAGDLYFVKLDMNNTKRVKAYIYDNLMVRADYNTLMTNIKNGHLHKVVENLLKDGIKRGTITFEEDGSASFMPII